ncbi:MAG: hypothetical protein E7586_05695 [Ruminococcaceae bacterium]|nr:hypothetical protein [Oscillospiraceae bacterium]
MKKTLSILLTIVMVIGCCASIFATTSVAAATIISVGKTYTFSGGSAHSSCPDTNGKELTDGSKGNANPTAAPYAGFQGGETYEFIVDLGSAQKSNVFTIYTAQNFWGVSIPKNLAVAYADSASGPFTNASGVAVSQKVKDGNVVDGYTSQLYTWTFTSGAEINARYIKFVITSANNKFLWMDEIEVAYDPDVKIDAFIPDDALRVHYVNKKVGQDMISVFTSLDNLANNQNGWGAYYQLRATAVPNEYVVVGTCNNPNPGDGSTFGAAEFKTASKFTTPAYCTDIYMAVNGAAANAAVYNMKVGQVVTFANLSLSTGEYASTYVTARAASGTIGGMINNKITETTLMHSVANLQTVSDLSVLSGENAPANGYFYSTDYEAILTECIKYNVLPTIRVDSVENANALVSVMKATGCYDVNVVSYSANVLKAARTASNIVRTGLIYTLTKSTVTSEEAHTIRAAVKSAPANFVMFTDAQYVSKQVVMELQQLGCPVWVYYGNADEAEIVKILATGANGIVTADANSVHQIINKHFVASSFTRTPTIVGHRGYANGGAIENTLESFKLAYEYGADIFELDVYSTTDNALVLYHDNKFAYNTSHNYNTNYSGSKYIEGMTLAEVQAVKYTKDNSAITLLPEVLEYFQDKDIRIFIEFKGGQIDRTVKYTAEAVKKYGMEDRIVVICSATGFLENNIKYFDGAVTNSFVYANNSITGYAPQDTPAWSYAETREENLSILAFTLNRIGHTNSNLGPALGAVSRGFNVDNFLGEAATNRGLQVNPWTYGSANNNNIGFFSDVDSITTDVTDWCTNMAKYVTLSGDISLEAGEAYDGAGFTYTTYGRKTNNVNSANIVYSVVSGDAVEVKDGKLVGVKEGTAQVLLGYKTKTTSGTDYVIYADLATVSVNGAATDVMMGDINGNGEIDSVDYSLLKRVYFGLYDVDLAISDINGNEEIDSTDYSLLKRAYFGAYAIN